MGPFQELSCETISPRSLLHDRTLQAPSKWAFFPTERTVFSPHEKDVGLNDGNRMKVGPETRHGVCKRLRLAKAKLARTDHSVSLKQRWNVTGVANFYGSNSLSCEPATVGRSYPNLNSFANKSTTCCYNGFEQWTMAGNLQSLFDYWM